MSVPIPGKWEWPELVGVLATLAATTIVQERPDVFVEVLPSGSPALPDFIPTRVCVYIDNNGIVNLVPKIG